MTDRVARMLFAGILLAFASVAHPIAAGSKVDTINGCQQINQSGSYQLTQNLVATGDCLVINVDFVTIDLAGFTIMGDGTGVGIKGTADRKAITLRDGTVSNFQDGISFCPSDPDDLVGHLVVVERIRALDNLSVGICLFNNNVAAGLTLKDSYVSGSGTYGVDMGGRAVVTGNTLIGNATGMRIGGTATIIGNTIAGNSHAGIISGNHSFDIVNNRIQGTDIGVQVFCPSVILGNVIAGAIPIQTFSGTGCTIDHNTTSTF